MLTDAIVENILHQLPKLKIGVVGDLFLDQYLELDHRLTEPSIETGLDAYQVTGIRNSPGAAGTILNNLAALGAGTVKVLSFVGTDGRGYDVRQELTKRGIDQKHLLETPYRKTPTYTKPMLSQAHGSFEELNRIDIKNLTPTPETVQLLLLEELTKIWQDVDAMIVLDQVSIAETGVVTSLIRNKLAELGQDAPRKLLLADSRFRIGLFRNCWAKPNVAECRHAMNQGANTGARDTELVVMGLAQRLNRPVFCTMGEAGICLANPFVDDVDCKGSNRMDMRMISGYAVQGPIDVVGAGDSTSAGIACAWAAGASLEEAAAFGNLIASITVQQIGTTGVATVDLVRSRWDEVRTQSLV